MLLQQFTLPIYRPAHNHQIPTTTEIAEMTIQFTLNTGAEIPAIGFGTWQDVNAQEEAVLEALRVGYRHIDTARMYEA